MFRGKVGDTGEFQFFFGSEGVSNLDGTVVVQADDVAWPGFFHIRSVLSHKNRGIGKGYFFSQAVMFHLHAPGEFS